MNSAPLRATVLFAVLLTILVVVGSLEPTIFTWGFHFLGFLPKSYLMLFVVLAVAATVQIARGQARSLLGRLARAFSETPALVLAAAVGIFIFAAVALRVKVPLLGDSFIVVKIFSRAAQGLESIPRSHQPLAFYYFYLFVRMFGSFDYPAMMNAFLAGELLLGAAYVLLVYGTVTSCFGEPLYRVLAFVLLLVLPSMEVLFGYVELYALPLALLAAYLCVSLLYLREKIPFAVVPVVFTLLLLSHYLNVFLTPSLLYLGVIEYRRGGARRLGVSAGVLAGVLLLGLAVIGFNIGRLMPPDRGTPILTVTPSDNVYQAYTLFSPYHLSDLANLAILLCPGALFLLIMTFRRDRALLTAAPLPRFLLIASAPVVLFILVARFDIPMAQDWDASSPFALLLALYALVAAERWIGDRAGEILGLIVLMTLLSSGAWWYLNSTVEPNIRRVREFIDQRISSHDGTYQSTFHLGEYFLRTRDTKRMAEICEQFVGMYPDDKRGYSNYTLYLEQFGKPMDAKIAALFDRWLAIDSTNPDAREQAASFHLEAGNRSYHDGEYAEAIGHYREAIRFAPSLPDAYNGLGITYRKLGENDSALVYYQQTLRCDSTSVYAYVNLGNLYDDLGDGAQAIGWYKKALAIHPDFPELLYNLGITYYKRGDQADALESLRRAAGLGDQDAQAFLRSHGQQW